MRNEAIEAAGPAGSRLRVEFIWRGDRYGHVVSVIEPDGTAQPLLESIEGAASEDWPASPPLQSLSIETLPDRRLVALLVGMAGGSHWSASVEPAPSEPGLIFDLACRHSKQPGRLGSRYRRLEGQAGRLEIKDVEMSVVDADQQVAIQPRSHSDLVGTTRWKYIVRPAMTERFTTDH